MSYNLWHSETRETSFPRYFQPVPTIMDAAAGQRDVVTLAVECLQERHEVLVVGEFLSDGKRHHHHVNGGVAFGQSAEERRDWSVQLFYGALGGGGTVVVIPGVTHSCWPEETEVHHDGKSLKKSLTSKPDHS